MTARRERQLGNQIYAIGGEHPDGEPGTPGEALQLKVGCLVPQFEGNNPLAIGRKPVPVSTFGVSAERRNIKGRIAIEKLSQLLRHTRTLVYSLLMRKRPEI